MTALEPVTSPVGAEVVIGGRRFLNFGGSCYLGLSGNRDVIEAGVETLRETGAGYQLPRRYGVTTRAHREVEAEAARYFHSEDALYLAAGYLFGLVALATCEARADVIFYDALAHHALRDAIAASPLPSEPYHHLDVDDLQSKLKALQPRLKPLVVTDGLFSTFGEIAPLDALAAVIEPFGGCLVVDESHAFGVLGANGRGACEHHGVEGGSVLIGGSTSKGLGATGGLVPTSRARVAEMRATRAGRGAAPGLPAAAAMCAASLRHVARHPELRERLRVNVARMKAGLRGLGLDVNDTVAPVAAFTMPSAAATRGLRRRLYDDGIFVFHSHYIGAGDAGVLRLGIFADHDAAQIDHLLQSLGRRL